MKIQSLYFHDVHFCVCTFYFKQYSKTMHYIYAQKNVEGYIFKKLITIGFGQCWGFYFLLYIHVDNLKFMITIYFYGVKKEIQIKETGEFMLYNIAQQICLNHTQKYKLQNIITKNGPTYCQLLCHPGRMSIKEIGEEFLCKYEELLFSLWQEILSL